MQSLKQGQLIVVGSYKLLVISLLGQGSFGMVYQVCDQINNKQIYALKIQDGMSDQEAKITQIIKDKNPKGIVKIYEFIKQYNSYLILMEYLPHNFYEIISTQTISEIQLRYIFKQLAETVKSLHDLNIAHRDLKPENILVDNIAKQQQRNQLTFKLCDFGISKIETQELFKTMNIGTPYYQSPEQLDNNVCFDKSVDIWALGAIFYEIITRKPLFNGTSIQQVQSFIKDKDYSVELINKLQTNQNFKSLILRMVEFDASKRITLNQIIELLQARVSITPVKKQDQILQMPSSVKQPINQINNQETKPFPQKPVVVQDQANSVQIKNNLNAAAHNSNNQAFSGQKANGNIQLENKNKQALNSMQQPNQLISNKNQEFNQQDKKQSNIQTGQTNQYLNQFEGKQIPHQLLNNSTGSIHHNQMKKNYEQMPLQNQETIQQAQQQQLSIHNNQIKQSTNAQESLYPKKSSSPPQNQTQILPENPPIKQNQILLPQPSDLQIQSNKSKIVPNKNNQNNYILAQQFKAEIPMESRQSSRLQQNQQESPQKITQQQNQEQNQAQNVIIKEKNQIQTQDIRIFRVPTNEEKNKDQAQIQENIQKQTKNNNNPIPQIVSKQPFIRVGQSQPPINNQLNTIQNPIKLQQQDIQSIQNKNSSQTYFNQSKGNNQNIVQVRPPSQQQIMGQVQSNSKDLPNLDDIYKGSDIKKQQCVEKPIDQKYKQQDNRPIFYDGKSNNNQIQQNYQPYVRGGPYKAYN